MNVEEIRKKVRSLCEDAGLQFFFAVPNASEWTVTDCEHLRKIVSYHKELETLPPVVPTQRWIPTSERLPEKDVEVLATTEWGEVTIAMYCVIDWFIHEGDTNAETDEIVAWMPLPEPYKAESEET